MKTFLCFLFLLSFSINTSFSQSPEIKWWFDTQSFCAGMAAAADLDGDGTLEIVFGCYRNDGGIYALKAADGSLMWSYFPHNPPHQGCNDTAPLIYDVDGNGQLDVIIASSCTPKTICLDGKTGELKWEAPTRGSDSPPSIADFNNDGRMQLLHGEFTGWVRNLDAATGELLWELEVHDNSWIQTAPTVVDLNNNGQLDFVVGTWAFDNTDSLYAFDGNTLERLWATPIHGFMYHGTGVADFDNDGIPDLLIGSYNDTLYCINGMHGEIKWKYAASGAVAAPVVIADIDNNGECDVVFTSWFSVTVLNSKGELKWESNIPDFTTSFRGPVVADINGDEYLDIIMGTYGGKLIAFDGKNGSLIIEVDLKEHYGNSPFNINHAPVIADFDGDGILDAFVVGGHGEWPNIENGYGRAYAVSLGLGNGPDWLMFQRDERRQSSMCYDYLTPAKSLLAKRSFIEVFPNPTSGLLNISGDFNTGSMEVYNALGQKLSKHNLQTGNTSIELPYKGFYILHFSVDGELISKKVMVR
nr:VCBS repeat-containing protein [Saprospiraceae bacterium]